ncbi:zinc finger BED domain-containing protein DAYSLEEPER-like [Senna tora]|uniref:Zinc finger BED domain-containing protein DAYSLEEPER-like n=1 Tax=Senna tora TaxID=362788 RepID=A0A834T8W0_9FABA|nr:zinc finger BED domain-containing protein DAYSLEEPER-like [Senna tora]
MEAEQDVNLGGDENLSKTEAEQPTRKKKKLTSRVWLQMTKLEDGSAKCNHCKKVFVAESSNGTSHLSRHLTVCKKRELPDIRKFSRLANSANQDGTISLGSWAYDWDRIRRSIANFIVCAKFPFSIVELPAFEEMIVSLTPQSKSISRHTIKRDIMSFHLTEKESVIEELVRSPGKIALTFDNWRAEHTDDEYMCIIAHWIDIDWRLHKRIICFKAISLPFTGISLADEIASCLSDWRIIEKIGSITLDNATYNDVMATYLKMRPAISKNLLKCFNIGGERDNSFRMFILSDEEWDKVKVLHNFLQPFYEVTVVFSASKNTTANIYFKGVCRIHVCLLETYKNPPEFMKDMISDMVAKFQKYWDEYSLLLSCSAVLDPRMKLQFIEYFFDKIYDNVDVHLDKIVATLQALFDHYKETPIETSSFSGDSTSNANFWRISAARFPKLLSMARDILAIPISTLASESTFSIGKKVINPWRSSMSKNTIEALVCLEDWLRAKGYKQGETIIYDAPSSDEDGFSTTNVVVEDVF